jgi:hypothetical protein
VVRVSEGGRLKKRNMREKSGEKFDEKKAQRLLAEAKWAHYQ